MGFGPLALEVFRQSLPQSKWLRLFDFSRPLLSPRVLVRHLFALLSVTRAAELLLHYAVEEDDHGQSWFWRRLLRGRQGAESLHVGRTIAESEVDVSDASMKSSQASTMLRRAAGKRFVRRACHRLGELARGGSIIVIQAGGEAEAALGAAVEGVAVPVAETR